MENKTDILLIEEGSSIITLRVVRSLGNTGKYRIHILSFSKRKIPAFRYSRYISSFSVHEQMNDDKALELIHGKIRSTCAEIVIPLMEKQTRIIVQNLPAFKGLCRFPPLPDPCTLELVIDKYLLSRWLFDSGFSRTKPVNLRHLKEGKYNINDLEFPLLIKPFWGSSGEGIVKLGAASQLQPVIDSNPGTNDFLIQPYFAGNDLDLSALVGNGRILAYTIQRPVIENNRFKYSKKIEFTFDATLLELCEKIFMKLNYSGIAHLDFRHNPSDQSYHLVDFNARYWSTISGSLKAGINFPDLACSLALDYPVKHADYRHISFLSSESIIYILFNSFRKKLKSLPFLFNNELYYGIRDPLPMLFNFITLVQAKFEWYFLRKKKKSIL